MATKWNQTKDGNAHVTDGAEGYWATFPVGTSAKEVLDIFWIPPTTPAQPESSRSRQRSVASSHQCKSDLVGRCSRERLHERGKSGGGGQPGLQTLRCEDR